MEGGGRYFGSLGQFQKTFGLLTNSGLPSLQSGSRLTFDDMRTHSGEFFGRIETPWNLFVKGYVGGGATSNGHLNDEDFIAVMIPAMEAAYSNTLSPAVTGSIGYGAIDGGYDFLHGPEYKAGVFAGCQSAFKFDPRSASNFDPLERRVRAVAFAPSELVGVAETARARVGV